VDQAEKVRAMGREARAILLRHWPHAILAHALAVPRCFMPQGLVDHLLMVVGPGRAFRILVRPVLIAYGLFVGLVVSGCLLHPLPRSLVQGILAAMALYMLAVTGIGAITRYVAPVVPILSIVASRVCMRLVRPDSG
jgi:O-antigen ligase